MRTNCPCDWRRAIFLRNDPATVQSRVDIILFSLPASDLSKRPPSDRQRGGQGRPLWLSREAIHHLFSLPPHFLYKKDTIKGKGKQSPPFLLRAKNSTPTAQ